MVGDRVADVVVVAVAERAGGVSVDFEAVAVADAPCFDSEPVAELDVAAAIAVAEGDVAAFDEAHVAHEADAAFFVGEVGPDHVVEDVGFDGVDGAGEGGELFGPRGVLEGGGVDGKAGEVVEVGVRDQVGGNEVAEEVGGVGFGGLVGDHEVGERARSEDEHAMVGIDGLRGWGSGAYAFGFVHGREVAGRSGSVGRPGSRGTTVARERLFRSQRRFYGRGLGSIVWLFLPCGMRQVLVQDSNDSSKMRASIDSQDRAFGPIGRGRTHKQAGNIVFTWSAPCALYWDGSACCMT